MRKAVYLVTIIVAALAGEASLVYRGRLVPNGRPNAETTFPVGQTKEMTFRIYDADGNSCVIKRTGVPVASNGTFSVLLDSAELATMLTNGTAVSVGLSVGNAPEIQSRRALLSLARANHATIAGGLARNARVGTLAANALVCDNLTAKGRVSAKTITAADGGRLKNIACRMPAVGAGQTLELVRGDGLSVFGKCQRLTLNWTTSMRAKAGVVLCKAPADGVATIRCVTTHTADGANDNHRRGSFPSFSIVRFYGKGEEIKVPSKSEWQWIGDDTKTEADFEVDFHPFLADLTGK